MTFDQICEAIATHSELGTPLTKEHVATVLKPWAEQQREALDNACRSLHNLMKSEGDWKFQVADGMTATVHFSGTPNKAHLKAFVAVFTVMAESYCEAIPACTSKEREPCQPNTQTK